MIRATSLCSVTLLLLFSCVTSHAQISASDNDSAPSTVTQYFGNESDGFSLGAWVEFDPNSGPWVKQLTNEPSGSPIASGRRVTITETLQNFGTVSWTDWHEEILTETLIDFQPQPGFLFDKNFLNLTADYGNGFQGLVGGVDYTVTEMQYNGPGSGNTNMGLQAIWIFFEPHAVIQPGDTLKIEKQIFEVHLDSNLWQPGEFVEIAQYPTVPEPSSCLLAAVLGFFLLGRGKRV
jgi:hypothetical protein